MVHLDKPAPSGPSHPQMRKKMAAPTPATVSFKIAVGQPTKPARFTKKKRILVSQGLNPTYGPGRGVPAGLAVTKGLVAPNSGYRRRFFAFSRANLARIGRPGRRERINNPHGRPAK
jgi:hypothetical protein